MIQLGSTPITDMRVGTRPIVRACVGTRAVWESAPPRTVTLRMLPYILYRQDTWTPAMTGSGTLARLRIGAHEMAGVPYTVSAGVITVRVTVPGSLDLSVGVVCKCFGVGFSSGQWSESIPNVMPMSGVTTTYRYACMPCGGTMAFNDPSKRYDGATLPGYLYTKTMLTNRLETSDREEEGYPSQVQTVGSPASPYYTLTYPRNCRASVAFANYNLGQTIALTVRATAGSANITALIQSVS